MILNPLSLCILQKFVLLYVFGLTYTQEAYNCHSSSYEPLKHLMEISRVGRKTLRNKDFNFGSQNIRRQ